MSSKRGVSFDMMETLERHSDSIDKLTSLVSKKNIKIDKKETQYKPRVYQSRPRGQSSGRQQNFSPAICLSAEIETEIEETIIIEPIIDPTIEIDPETVIDVTIGETTIGPMKDGIIIDKRVGGEMATGKTIEIDKIIEEMTPDKDTETGMKVGIDPRNYSNDSARGRDRKRDSNRDGWVQPRSRTLSDDREKSRSRSNSRVSTNRD